MKYIYGPIKSRRLGLSLGLSLTPLKVCSLDCIYCQWGRTTQLCAERKEYVEIEALFAELKAWFKDNAQTAEKLKIVTISGLGEPTLNTNLGAVIKRLKGQVDLPVAVITNSTLLADAQVRAELLGADLLVPSLDASTEEIFARIDRPAGGVKLKEIIAGLIALRKEFSGRIWLEIMFIAGLNDSPKQVEGFKEIIARINPDKIQLNSPVRSTAESNVLAVERAKLEDIRDILGPKAEII